MVKVHACLCLGLIPVTALAAESARQRGAMTFFHYQRPPMLAFGSSHQPSSGDSSADKVAQDCPPPRTRGSRAKKSQQPRELSTAPASVLASVKAVASDVDGTLTKEESSVSRRTIEAVKAMLDSDLVFFPATGKTRAGMYQMLGEEVASHLRAKDTPGVFIQGLVVYKGSSDEVLYERVLEASIVKQVASFCEERGVSVIAYCGDRLVCSKKDARTDKIADYMEPMPEAVGPLPEAMEGGLKIHKLLLMDTTEGIEKIRPDVQELVAEEATLTQALPDMLEVLPPGASKGKGVELLLEHLGIDPSDVMALGDAENDVDMLRLAGVGICVGNASGPAKAVARFIAPTNEEDGAAEAMERVLECTSSPRLE